MNLQLFEAIVLELHRRGNSELRQAKDRVQFYVHSTRVVNAFSEVATLPIAASWYQETLGMALIGMLGTDRQKLAILQCFLLKNA